MPHALEVQQTNDLDSIQITVKLDLRMLNLAKQREPEVVEFRAARIKQDANREPIMLHAELKFDENSPYEWLDHDGKPQTFKVVLS